MNYKLVIVIAAPEKESAELALDELRAFADANLIDDQMDVVSSYLEEEV